MSFFTRLSPVLLVLLLAPRLHAQDVVATFDEVDFDSPEGWAMAHTVSSTLNLGISPPRETEPFRLSASAQLSTIPHISGEDRRVGFSGTKLEDLNKSPVFSRGTVHLGLPADFRASLSWTPPLEIDGSRARDLFAVALERPLFRRAGWNLGARIFAQWGDAEADITCSEDVASRPPGSADNPFGCREPSDDRIRLDHQGAELSVSRTVAESWRPWAAVAVTRMDPHVQVNARVFEVLDRSELQSSGNVTSFTLGTGYRSTGDWNWSAAFSWTPLDVHRPPDGRRESDDFWSIRLGLSWDGPLLSGP